MNWHHIQRVALTILLASCYGNWNKFSLDWLLGLSDDFSYALLQQTKKQGNILYHEQHMNTHQLIKPCFPLPFTSLFPFTVNIYLQENKIIPNQDTSKTKHLQRSWKQKPWSLCAEVRPDVSLNPLTLDNG